MLSQKGSVVTEAPYREVFSHALRCCVGSALHKQPVILLRPSIYDLVRLHKETYGSLGRQQKPKARKLRRMKIDAEGGGSKGDEKAKKAFKGMESKKETATGEEKETSSSSISPGLFVQHREGLFPKAISPDNQMPLAFAPMQRRCNVSNASSFRCPLSLYRNVGRLVAQAVLEGRILDVDLSPPLLTAISGSSLSSDDLRYVDQTLAKSLKKLRRVAVAYTHYRALSGELDQTDIESAQNIDTKKVEAFSVDGCKVQDLCLYFCAPGMDVELMKGGANEQVRLDNVDNYVRKVYKFMLHDSVAPQIQALREGFNQICSTSALSVLKDSERQRLTGGDSGKIAWDFSVKTLVKHVRCAQGYTSSSQAVRFLFDVLSEMDIETQRAFVRFLTGCPRLPAGQLASLRPPVTVVRVPWSKANPNALPLASTCTNYLKLPDYPAKELLRERIYYCIRECPHGFQLS